ncbi:USP8 dimerization domain containing protein [Parasponia andersonii]|uniref:USP8 dimerization domain containing protein n=1 Tax=Parasponia andersonii TaxID=3476 RepID=A0A2P5CLW5_PARAD|nr:USP8 dimerization domain containing protein [Parasponia andersonii]
MKINVNSKARKVEVDNRFSLRQYYRIADNLLKQVPLYRSFLSVSAIRADVYREEKNLVDLYVMLLRFSSLVTETIPYHRDYQVVLPKERILYKKKLLNVLDELESLKPEVNRRVRELNEAHSKDQLLQLDGPERTSYDSQTSLQWPFENKQLSTINVKKPTSMASQSSWRYNNGHSSVSYNSMPIDEQFQKLSVKVSYPNKETLSRHSFLGPNGLRGQWLGPSVETKVISCGFKLVFQLNFN